MGPDELTLRGQSHIHQALLLQQGVHHVDDGRLVVVPFQAVLLRHLRGRGARHPGLCLPLFRLACGAQDRLVVTCGAKLFL